MYFEIENIYIFSRWLSALNICSSYRDRATLDLNLRLKLYLYQDEEIKQQNANFIISVFYGPQQVQNSLSL